MQAKTLGLSMIVKNEAHVLLRLLTSVAPIIDYWAIADTGSTDGTQELITNFFKEKGIPGELIQIGWKDDFSYARNVALDAIEDHVDYGFWIDADEELVIDTDFVKGLLLEKDIDSISVKTIYGKVDYTRKNIWKTKVGYKWDGPIHELLSSPNEKVGYVAEGMHVIVRPEGSSWGNVKEKYANHAKILSKYTEVNKDPRWIFYTAQSYRDSSDYETAIEWYRKRANIVNEGFYEEIFISKFMIAKLSEVLGRGKQECTLLYQDAHATDSTRGESIKSMIEMYHRAKDWENAYVYSLYGLRYNLNNPYPNRILFLDKGLYDYEMLELHSLSCFYTKRIEEGSVFYWMMRRQLDALGPNYLSPEQTNRILTNEQYFPKTNAFSRPKPVAQSKVGSKFTPKKKKR
jgi:glycosyltransferase involved in cell wall biosynthesis